VSVQARRGNPSQKRQRCCFHPAARRPRCLLPRRTRRWAAWREVTTLRCYHCKAGECALPVCSDGCQYLLVRLYCRGLLGPGRSRSPSRSLAHPCVSSSCSPALCALPMQLELSRTVSAVLLPATSGAQKHLTRGPCTTDLSRECFAQMLGVADGRRYRFAALVLARCGQSIAREYFCAWAAFSRLVEIKCSKTQP